MKRVSIIGLGYIGLPTAILCAEAGYHVLGCDTSTAKITSLSKGQSPILEPEIQERLSYVLKKKSLK